MSAPAVCAAPAALAQCRQILGGAARDSFSIWWDAASYRSRVLLLQVADVHEDKASRMWSEFSGAEQARIKVRTRDYHNWLGKILPVIDREGVEA